MPAITPAIAYIAPDPEIFSIGFFTLRWYSLAYIAGILAGWACARKLAPRHGLAPERVDELVTWLVPGIVAGGRLGYVLFYQPGVYLSDPAGILRLWEGGMSFHGGLAGVIVVLALQARRNRQSLWKLSDVLAQVAPIGLFFGRIANYINGELWGRPTSLPWGMVFPGADEQPRHPSQLYEALLEGLVLFLLLRLVAQRSTPLRDGQLSGVFLLGYAAARLAVETVREPDSFLGYFPPGMTMGQILTLPMLPAGMWLLARGWRTRG